MNMNQAWTLHIDDDWIAWLTFDAPGEKVNTFNATSLSELEQLVAELAGNEAIKAVAIRSGKDGNFIAGADISELARLESPEQAAAIARRGQDIFNAVAQLPVPVVAVINGSCMGGGLELALACDFRLVTDEPKTTLALPEVKLGILPAWGGTTRLPRLVGLPRAMEMILTGRAMDARKAYRIGLADAVIARSFLETATADFIDTVLRRRGRKAVRQRRVRVQPRLLRWMQSMSAGRALMFRKARKQIKSRTNGHYPAPYVALETLRKTCRAASVQQSLQAEADALAELACGPVCRHLVWLFQAGQKAKKLTVPIKSHPTELGQAAVIGAGIMGSGIAWACANAGLNVRLKDVNDEALARGVKSIASNFDALVRRRRMTAGGKAMAMHRVTTTTGFAGFGSVDIVIEAIVEDMQVKQRVLREIEANVSPDTILCTNTSSLPLDELASCLRHPQRFVGLHFFNPVNRMPLVEIVPAMRTSPDAIAAAVQLVQRMGKTPAVVGACAGFLVNRILVPYLVESAWMMEEGADPARIDELLVEFGMPMGPLTLVDEVGIDVGHAVARVLESAYGQRMKVPAALTFIADTGEFLGRKNGRGIYTYQRGRQRPNPTVRELVEEARQREHVCRRQLGDDDIIDRAVLLMINEAARCLDEQVAGDPESLDLAMVMGTGFAPFRGGLLRYADERGVAAIRDRLNELAVMFGERFAPAPLLERIASNGGRFYGHEYTNRGSRTYVA